MKAYIEIGKKRLSSIYPGDLAYTEKYVGINEKDADNFGRIKIAAPQKVFVARLNSWLLFENEQDAINSINHQIEDFKIDERYNEKIKKSLIKYAENLKTKIIIQPKNL